jgi:lipopolysaccharide/colanic/teichoic acid biosynthesis glycosyltransferase
MTAPPASMAVRSLDRRAVRPATGAAAKRSLDIVLAAALLLILLPVIAVVALLVRLDSPGPSFFRCTRVGYRNRALRMLKFRKMWVDAAGAPLTSGEDERFTRIGRWLAKSKIDELPQLWHVLVGEMSFVGPRPESVEFVDRYDAVYRDLILKVRPGIVGPSQIAFAAESEILDRDDPVTHYVERILPQKVDMDAKYAAGRTLRLDFRILFWAAVTVVLRRPIAVDRATMRMTLRRR